MKLYIVEQLELFWNIVKIGLKLSRFFDNFYGLRKCEAEMNHIARKVCYNMVGLLS